MMDMIENYEMKNTTDLCQELPNFIKYIEQSTMKDIMKSRLNVSTIHCAKGLEYRCVFILEANHDIFQASQNGNDNELELLYVAISRAKERLFITWVCSNNNIHNGITEFLKPLLNLSSDKVVQEFFSSAQTSKSTSLLPLSPTRPTITSKFMKSSELLNNSTVENNSQLVWPASQFKKSSVLNKTSPRPTSSTGIVSSFAATSTRNNANSNVFVTKKYEVPYVYDDLLPPEHNDIRSENSEVHLNQLSSNLSNPNPNDRAVTVDENCTHANFNVTTSINIGNLDNKTDSNKGKPFSLFAKFIPQSNKRKRETEL
jgi:ATP-dependent exoDNAse (exonuclease V) beta subunit